MEERLLFYLVDENAWDYEEYGDSNLISFNVDWRRRFKMSGRLWREIVRRGPRPG